MENEKRIRLGICTPDGPVYRRLGQLAELWGQEMCIRLDIYPAQADSPGTPTCCFLRRERGRPLWTSGPRAAARQAISRP